MYKGTRVPRLDTATRWINVRVIVFLMDAGAHQIRRAYLRLYGNEHCTPGDGVVWPTWLTIPAATGSRTR